MTKPVFCVSIATGLLLGLTAMAQPGLAQSDAKATLHHRPIAHPAGFPALPGQNALIEFPLPKGEQAYAAIDGQKMHKYVVELAEISKRYRDAGHPKFWGRIMGTSSDRETEEWLAGKFRRSGLSDVRIQQLDLPPQWMPQSWGVSMTGGGKTIMLESAQPDYYANGLPPGGVELDAVYAGLGTEADFAGKDVRGKAVFVYSMLGAPDERAVKRAEDKGAAVIFEVSMLPGNMRYQAYPSGTKAPAFTSGNDDGAAARRMIEAAGRGAKVKVSLDVQKVPNLQDRAGVGHVAGRDRRNHLCHRPQGWLVRRRQRQCAAASPPCWVWRNITPRSPKPSASALWSSSGWTDIITVPMAASAAAGWPRTRPPCSPRPRF